MNDCPLVWVIIGVAGSGKTRVGRLLAEKLECDFLEGDRRHPLPNVLKMNSQKPLQDEDRRQWLTQIEEDIQAAVDRNRETVLTCSALKVSYRQQLSSLPRVQLVLLDVPETELQKRLANRPNHYMKPVMLDSQLATFEPITPEENVVTVNGLLSPTEIVEQLLSQITRRFPNMKNSWWDRCF